MRFESAKRVCLPNLCAIGEELEAEEGVDEDEDHSDELRGRAGEDQSEKQQWSGTSKEDSRIKRKIGEFNETTGSEGGGRLIRIT